MLIKEIAKVIKSKQGKEQDTWYKNNHDLHNIDGSEIIAKCDICFKKLCQTCPFKTETLSLEEGTNFSIFSGRKIKNYDKRIICHQRY